MESYTEQGYYPSARRVSTQSRSTASEMYMAASSQL